MSRKPDSLARLFRLGAPPAQQGNPPLGIRPVTRYLLLKMTRFTRRRLILFVSLALLALALPAGFAVRAGLQRRTLRRALAALTDTSLDWRERNRARTALARVGAPAVPPLQGLLHFDPAAPEASEFAHLAALALGDMGPRARPAIPDLLPLLRDHDERHTLGGDYLSGVAAGALGKIGKAALPAVTPFLRDPDWRTRFQALWACQVMGRAAQTAIPDLLPLLKDPNPGVRAAAAYALGSQGPQAAEAIPGIIALLGDRAEGGAGRFNFGGNVARVALHSLLLIGKPAVPHLKDALTHGDPAVRAGAEEAMLRILREADLPDV